MKPFKFLRSPIINAHDGGYIYAGEYFYSMNKEEMESVIRPGEMIPKYTIVRRRVDPIYKDVFKPDYDKLWYFKSERNADYLKRIWENQDIQRGGELFHQQAEIMITISRPGSGERN